MQSEIEELRAQVDELKAEREAREQEQAGVSRQQATTEPLNQVPGTTESAEAAEESGKPESGDLASQFQELFETIDEELKAANPLTVLVVFALGVLVGRLLPR